MMKERLDVLLVKRNLAASREKAKALIMAGVVYVNGQKEDKAGTAFEDTVSIEVRGNTLPYVSRGGLKLEKAMACFGLDLKDRICMDVGHPPEGLRTACFKMERLKSTRWTWAMDSWTGSCARTSGWCAWRGPTSAM